MGRPCFAEGGVGLASIAYTEPESNSKPFFSRSRRNTSSRSLSSRSPTFSPSSTPRSRCKDHKKPHFLGTCFLCKRSLTDKEDIFMYRGDTPFCSFECRQEQIDFDEAKEKLQSFSLKTMRVKTTPSTPNESENCQARTNAVAAC